MSCKCIDYRQDVSNFKLNAIKPESDVAVIHQHARRILDKYIIFGAPMQINVSSKLRNETVKCVIDRGHSPLPECFDAAQSEAFRLMEQNLWSQFQKTETFHILQQRKSKW